MTWVEIIFGLIQAAIIFVLAPIFYGFYKKLIAKLQNRIGPPVVQPLRDLRKLWSKKMESRPDVHTWVYTVAPIVVLSCMMLLAISFPVFINIAVPLADILLIIYVLALTRFFLSIAAFDTGSPYSAVGAWRENTVAVLIEILMLFALFIPALECRSTSLYTIVAVTQSNWVELWTRPSYIISAIIFGVCILIESGIIPFDVAEAEQEIQEGLLQEYSGRSLALMQYSTFIKKLIIFTLFIDIYIPFGIAITPTLFSIALGIVLYLVKVFILIMLTAFVTVLSARIRFIEMSHSITPLYVFMVCALVCYLLGW